MLTASIAQEKGLDPFRRFGQRFLYRYYYFKDEVL